MNPGDHRELGMVPHPFGLHEEVDFDPQWLSDQGFIQAGELETGFGLAAQTNERENASAAAADGTKLLPDH